jgi:hypothetical protein
VSNRSFNNKGVTVADTIKRRLKKAHRISNKTLVVIDEALVKQLSIDGKNTWVEQVPTEEGILLKIQRRNESRVEDKQNGKCLQLEQPDAAGSSSHEMA